MSIHTSSDLKPGMLFTKHGEDVWELVAFCRAPTFTLRNLRSGAEEHFGEDSLIAAEFNPLRIFEPNRSAICACNYFIAQDVNEIWIHVNGEKCRLALCNAKNPGA